jgi:OmpR-family two-component system manganese-sensing response regulator
MQARLLIVDDDPRVQRALMRLLRHEGYEIHVADCAARAAQLSSSEQFDLIIVDWVLPDGDGLSVVKKLRSEGVRCPIIVLTGNPDAANPVAVLDAGADDFVIKLGNPDELLARVRAHLRRAPSTNPPEPTSQGLASFAKT